ncbi:hypothetical protein PLIIFM63780_002227 [Purpureocillium lilacinum]|nr:hypothetical protein PLIIFM63780_002227 [Purpureocillium lilacinum]
MPLGTQATRGPESDGNNINQYTVPAFVVRDHSFQPGTLEGYRSCCFAVISATFGPVQERSILLPSTAISWDVDNSFKAEQRHQHDKAHALWKRSTTVVMLDEQMRAAGDPELQRLLTRIRLGGRDHTDLKLLNSRCYREGRRIPWKTGITVVTPLNRKRWNLNMEASMAFRIQQRLMMRIFISALQSANISCATYDGSLEF